MLFYSHALYIKQMSTLIIQTFIVRVCMSWQKSTIFIILWYKLPYYKKQSFCYTQHAWAANTKPSENVITPYSFTCLSKHFGLSHWPICSAHIATNTHTHPFNGPFSGTTQVSRYQKGRTNLDFTEATDSEWQWHQLGQMQICTSLQTDNHASTPQLSFLQAGCPSCRPTNSVKALKAHSHQVPH